MDLSNTNINLINLHAGIWRFASNILDVFSAVYLLSLGLPYPVVALAVVGSLLLRSVLRPISLVLSQKVGLRRALIFGAVISSGLFLTLTKISGINFWLYFYIVYSALTDITYWLPYHSYYAAAGDEESRGKQVGPQLGIVTLFRTAAPLFGGIIIAHFGYLPLYLFGTVITLVSIIPLVLAREVSPGLPLSWRDAFRSIDKRGLVMQVGDGILYMHGFVWTIVLFLLVKNYTLFGGLVTFELLVTSLLCVLLGYYIDKGKGTQIAATGLALTGLVIIFRAFFAHTIPEVMLSDLILALAATFYSSSFDVSFYNLAKESKNTLWFHFFGELGWDWGAAIGLAMSALLSALGMPLRFIILFSIPGLFVVNHVVRRFYSQGKKV